MKKRKLEYHRSEFRIDQLCLVRASQAQSGIKRLQKSIILRGFQLYFNLIFM